MKRTVKKIFEILFLSAFVFSGFAQDSESDFKGELYESKKLIVNKGDSMLFLDGSSGNFGFYAIPEQGDPIPLLSTYDSFSSTYLGIKASTIPVTPSIVCLTHVRPYAILFGKFLSIGP